MYTKSLHQLVFITTFGFFCSNLDEYAHSYFQLPRAQILPLSGHFYAVCAESTRCSLRRHDWHYILALINTLADSDPPFQAKKRQVMHLQSQNLPFTLAGAAHVEGDFHERISRIHMHFAAKVLSRKHTRNAIVSPRNQIHPFPK